MNYISKREIFEVQQVETFIEDHSKVMHANNDRRKSNKLMNKYSEFIDSYTLFLEKEISSFQLNGKSR